MPKNYTNKNQQVRALKYVLIILIAPKQTSKSLGW
jgi:hypothetical protein